MTNARVFRSVMMHYRHVQFRMLIEFGFAAFAAKIIGFADDSPSVYCAVAVSTSIPHTGSIADGRMQVFFGIAAKRQLAARRAKVVGFALVFVGVFGAWRSRLPSDTPGQSRCQTGRF